MERIIRHITRQLVNLLPDDYRYYRLDELRSWDFPPFIIQRIRVELERNLAESMNLPKTDWADMESPSIQAVWEQFIEAIRQEARLPASFVKPVIETAVADVLDMLVQPRKNLPEIIFGADQELTYDQIEGRMNAIVVYRHFAALIPRYMQKKELDKLTKERCTEIIANVDTRLTKRYSPLNWAQMLDPLFSLLDQRIDTNLLRLFFEDKKMPRLARQFDQLNSSVDRAQLIEVLSSPESLNMEGYEDEQTEPVGANEHQNHTGEPVKPEKKEVPPGTNGKLSNGKSEAEQELSSKKQSKHTSRRSVLGKDPIVDAFHKFRKDLKEAEEELDKKERNGEASSYAESEYKNSGTRERNYLNDIFRNPEDDDEAASDHEQSKPAGTIPESKQDTGESDTTSSASEQETPTQDDTIESRYAQTPAGPSDLHNRETEQDDEVPIWKRFLSPEELAEVEAREEEERLTEGGLADEQRADFAKGSPGSSSGDAELLRKLLKDNKNFFVAEIFKGSEQAYDKTVAAIALKKDWKSASEYINREVFKRNLVDMYSEAAVDFTDRLHTYFLQNQNRKEREI